MVNHRKHDTMRCADVFRQLQVDTEPVAIKISMKRTWNIYFSSAALSAVLFIERGITWFFDREGSSMMVAAWAESRSIYRAGNHLALRQRGEFLDGGGVSGEPFYL